MGTQTGAGRFAPSPSGPLHLGNARTAILAWLFARASGRRFLLRVEDLDPQRSRADAAAQQLAELKQLGLDWDGPVVWQSRRGERYRDALETLQREGVIYECFCTRREIQEASSAPHGAPGAYPGTCRNLSDTDRERLRRIRRPALRLRVPPEERRGEIIDLRFGQVCGEVDDMVLRRRDGVPSYNLAVVVDDLAQGVDQVVRGDDLLSSAPRQAFLARCLGGRPPVYAHVPLVVRPDGTRLAKRDGDASLPELAAAGWDAARVRAIILDSVGLPDLPLHRVVERFDPAAVPREPWCPTLPERA